MVFWDYNYVTQVKDPKIYFGTLKGKLRSGSLQIWSGEVLGSTLSWYFQWFAQNVLVKEKFDLYSRRKWNTWYASIFIFINMFISNWMKNESNVFHLKISHILRPEIKIILINKPQVNSWLKINQCKLASRNNKYLMHIASSVPLPR